MNPFGVQQQNLFQQTLPTILCCMCGVPIASNPSNMCVTCIRNQVDITDGIPKQVNISFCKGCGRYHVPPNQWIYAELESKELLAFCIKRVKGLNKVKLVDAGFVWTEPHSKRLKIKLTIQKEVFTSTILQQVFVIEYVVHGQQCDKCTKVQSNDTWQAVCQVRQKVDHKRTFFFLEQLILRHNAHTNCTNIKEVKDGIDFFYNHKSHAAKMVDFLQAVCPMRWKTSERLVSADLHNNTANMKHTYCVEIAPVCKDDLVCFPTKLAMTCGNISPFLLCTRVASLLYFVDPVTLQTCELTGSTFWQYPFRGISSSKQLIEFTVLDINPLPATNAKFQLAEVQVARKSDFGRNDTTFYTRTHLGYILKVGDTALGYDVSTAIFNDADLAPLKNRSIPEIILVKKTYPERRTKRRQRHWRVKTLNKIVDEDMKPAEVEKSNRDFEIFMNDIEEDPEYRSQFNLYKADNAEQIMKSNKAQEEDDMAENAEDFPDVGLEELIDDLTLDDNENDVEDDE